LSKRDSSNGPGVMGKGGSDFNEHDLSWGELGTKVKGQRPNVNMAPAELGECRWEGHGCERKEEGRYGDIY